MEFDLRQLRYFVAIAQAGGFSKAAVELGIAQSALSHHIAQMESRLGVTLFGRSSKGVTLTESGQRFHEHARSILAAVETATVDVRDDAREPGGLVRLGVTLTIMPELIGPLMTRLGETAPRITLRILDRISPQLVQALGDGEIDIALCFNAGEDPRIKATPLFEEDLCLVGAPGLIGDSETPVKLEDALSYPLLLPGRDHILRGMIERVALFRNRPIEVRHECFSIHALYAGLERGVAASLISKCSALAPWRAGLVVCRPIVEPPVTRRLFVAVRADSPRTKAENAVVREVVAIVRDGVTSGNWPDARMVEPVTPP